MKTTQTWGCTLALALSACQAGEGSAPGETDTPDTETGTGASSLGEDATRGPSATSADDDGTVGDATGTKEDESTGAPPEDPGGWSLVQTPVALGEQVTDVVAAGDSVWIGVSSFEGVRLLMSTNAGPWEEVADDVGLPATLTRGSDGEVWLTGSPQFRRLDATGVLETIAINTSVWNAAGTWATETTVLGFGGVPFGYEGWVVNLAGASPEPPPWLYAPVRGAAVVDDELWTGDQFGVSRTVDGTRGPQSVLALPIGLVTDMHPDEAGVLIGSTSGVVVDHRGDQWSFFPTGGNAVLEIDATAKVAWFVGETLGVRTDGQWRRLDEPDAPTAGRRVTIGGDGAVYVLAEERDLWRREPGPVQAVDFDDAATASLVVDGTPRTPLAVWIVDDGSRLIVVIPFEDPVLGLRTLILEYDAQSTSSFHDARIVDLADGTTVYSGSMVGSTLTDPDTGHTEGTANTAYEDFLSLSWEGPYGGW